MKYEYKTVITKTSGILGGKVNADELENMLNQLGAQGWELVSSVPSAEAYGRTSAIVSIFKRARTREENQ